MLLKSSTTDRDSVPDTETAYIPLHFLLIFWKRTIRNWIISLLERARKGHLKFMVLDSLRRCLYICRFICSYGSNFQNLGIKYKVTEATYRRCSYASNTRMVCEFRIAPHFPLTPRCEREIQKCIRISLTPIKFAIYETTYKKEAKMKKIKRTK